MSGGDVCIYPGAGWNGGHPSSPVFYYYGCYNLSDEIGIHRVFNNQTGGAKVQFFMKYNCLGSATQLGSNSYSDVDLTPINSIALVK